MTGLPIYLHYKNRTASLDRIDDKQGYTINNVQFIHKDINYMKWQFDIKYLQQMATAITNWQLTNGVKQV